MVAKTSSTSKRTRPRKINAGDRVRMPYGIGEILADVIEDRGFIGIGGRQLIRVRVNPGKEWQEEFEVPAEEVKIARRARRTRRKQY